jgi:MoxR-like ATPase
VFAELVLADEVTRATPKAQSALLEAMEEHQVSADGTTHALPSPYFVVATQYSFDQIGTFPLPESQLNRFLMRVELGYPNEASERELMMGTDRRQLLTTIEPCLNSVALAALQNSAAAVHMSTLWSTTFKRWFASRGNLRISITGLSPWGSLALVAAAKAHAYIGNHPSVFPDAYKQYLDRLPGTGSNQRATPPIAHRQS